MPENPTAGETRWFVMRDLKRANAKNPAYKVLSAMGLEVFTPMKVKILNRGGKRVRVESPFLTDLLFVHSTREIMDPIVGKTTTLQYRYVFGGYREPMVVADADMDAFISAVRSCDSPRYYSPGEVTASMLGRKVAVVGGPMDGIEGRLLSVRGSKVRRLVLDIPGVLSASVEISPEFIRLV